MFRHISGCLIKNGLHGSVLASQLNKFRMISSAEIATALRPFYFVVHPDLFGRYPEQRLVNEESLKLLSAYLEALQQRRVYQAIPQVLSFYVRDSDREPKHAFKLVKISLERNNDTKSVVKRILKLCNLSTDYVDNIRSISKKTLPLQGKSSKFYDDETFGNIDFKSSFTEFEKQFRAQKENKEKTLKLWLENNIKLAHKRHGGLVDLKEEVFKLEKSLVKRLEIIELRYDCGWNFEHYRGCLKTLERLADLHQQEMQALKNRIVVFAAFTGVSLEGHVMLYTGDVLNSWLDFIKNIPKHDIYLKRIPAYEVALSQVLRNIKIGRRKFMPKAQAYQYAGHLSKITTALLDFLSKQKYPQSWPNDLKEYEIVIESEAGPLMVSPTGQFIAPATCPGSILVDFLTTHVAEAKKKSEQYNRNKHIERELHKRCIDELNLKSLKKDDSVTPERMIKSLEKLLNAQPKNLANIHLNIANYYSVLSDGIVCIPWDWKLE